MPPSDRRSRHGLSSRDRAGDGYSGYDGDEDFVVAEIIGPAEESPGDADGGEPGFTGSTPAGTTDGGRSMTPHSPARWVRSAWIAVGLVAIAGLIVGPKLATQHVAGAATPVWFDAPPVGACLNLQDPVTEVPCSGPHDAEVTKSYGPRDTIYDSGPSGTMDGACRTAMSDYVGTAVGVEDVTVDGRSGPPSGGGSGAGPIPGSDGWHLPGLNALSDTVVAPPEEHTGPHRWMVCVVRPHVQERYLGTVHQVTPDTIPAAYRTCWGPDGPYLLVSCAQPHTSEVVAVADRGNWGWDGTNDPGDRPGIVGVTINQDPVLASPADPNEPGAQSPEDEQKRIAAKMAQSQAEVAQQLTGARQQLDEQCLPVAAGAVGADDPTYQGALAVTNASATGPLASQTVTHSDGSIALTFATIATPLCVVSTSGSQQLTQSIIGWGPKPLPLTAGG